MSTLTARALHQETRSVLDEVKRGGRFLIERRGEQVASLAPVRAADDSWEEIMAEVWAAQKTVKTVTPNPVLAERKRRRQ